ncbi:MAG: Mrp/NBP35 family ATP-binding protein [Gemmatimonadaceae bacterium]
MGPLTFRTYRYVDGDDRSQLGAQVGAQRARVAARMSHVRHVVAVISGKGGVGKSWVTAALATSLAPTLGAIGVLDADLKSPTTGSLLGARGPLRVTDDGVPPAIGHAGIAVMSMDLMLADGAPLTWRGDGGDRFLHRGILETGALRELLADIAWGPLDLLLVDMPPDADRIEDLAELVPSLTGALVVTLPSAESRRSVARAMRCALDAGIRLLGIVENMSGYACPGCSATRPLFAGDAGASLASEFGTALLGALPFVPQGRVPSAPTIPWDVARRVAEALG